MKIEAIITDDRPKLEQEAKEMMEAVSAQYVFPNTTIHFEPFTDLEIDELGVKLPANPEYILEYVEAESIVVMTDRESNTIVLELADIIAQRVKNLIEETQVTSAADAPEERIIQRVVVSCGYATDLRSLLLTAKHYGLSKCWGARPSCGAADLLVENDDFLDANISTIGFETPDGDRVEVLYLGKYTSDIEFIHRVISRLATIYEFDMDMLGIDDLR